MCNVSETLLECIDRGDCLHAMYGDPAVPQWRLGVFGLCQKLPDNASDQIRDYYGKFEHFRETIHAVLFVKNSSGRGLPYVESDLEYNLVPNCDLMREDEIGEIDRDFGSFLEPWRDPNEDTWWRNST